ncbi:MAG: DUF2752 domain-containing protein, partial [Spartobacteria bacterium]
ALPCGFKALTGLPCLFCGGTRSACAALRGDFAHSLYLNARSSPFLGFILLIAVASAVEVARKRPITDWRTVSKPLLKLASIHPPPAHLVGRASRLSPANPQTRVVEFRKSHRHSPPCLVPRLTDLPRHAGPPPSAPCAGPM